MSHESRIVPLVLVRGALGYVEESASWHDADLFRVEVAGLRLGDYDRASDAHAAYNAAHCGVFPPGMLPEYAERIRAALAARREGSI